MAPSENLQTPASRPPLTFEEAIAGGDTAPRPCPVRAPGNDCRNTRKNVRRDQPESFSMSSWVQGTRSRGMLRTSFLFSTSSSCFCLCRPHEQAAQAGGGEEVEL